MLKLENWGMRILEMVAWRQLIGENMDIWEKKGEEIIR